MSKQSNNTFQVETINQVLLVDGLDDPDVGDGGGLLPQQLDMRVQDGHVRRFSLLQNRN